jgi:hypothetical protein
MNGFAGSTTSQGWRKRSQRKGLFNPRKYKRSLERCRYGQDEKGSSIDEEETNQIAHREDNGSSIETAVSLEQTDRRSQ